MADRHFLTGTSGDPGGRHANVLARNSAVGIGMPIEDRAWCCLCEEKKPLKGSVLRGQLRVCADCKGGKSIAPETGSVAGGDKGE